MRAANNAADGAGVVVLTVWLVNDGLPTFVLIVSAIVVAVRAYNEIMTAIERVRARRAAKAAA